MKSQNSYLGVNPIIVKCIKYHACSLSYNKYFINDSLEDIELELFYETWSRLDQYDAERSSFSTFVAQLTKSCANNLLHKRQCMKYTMVFDVDDDIPDHRCLESDIAARFDTNYIIATLPEPWRDLCELLKVFTVIEVSKITGVPRATIYNILKQIRYKISPLK